MRLFIFVVLIQFLDTELLLIDISKHFSVGISTFDRNFREITSEAHILAGVGSMLPHTFMYSNHVCYAVKQVTSLSSGDPLGPLGYYPI